MKNIANISYNMFENCFQLVTIDMPHAILINENAFIGCFSLKTLYFIFVIHQDLINFMKGENVGG